MSEPSAHPFVVAERERRRRKRRRVLFALLAMILFAAAALVGLYKYIRYVSERELAEAIAETDRLDPGWRLADIEKRRSALTPEQNAAVPIKAAADLVVVVWSPEDIDPKHPERQLDPKRAAKLRELLKPMLPAAALARKAQPLKTGYYPVQLDVVQLDVNAIADHGTQELMLGRFLALMALLESEDEKHDDAWQTSLTILAAARSFGEEPLFSMNERQALQTLTVQALERCLAQGKVSDALLAQAQLALAEEAAQPVLLFTLRGHRAQAHQLMTELEAGKIGLDQLGSMAPEITFQLLVAGRTYEQEHAWMLRHFNEAVQCTNLPWVEMLAKMRELEKNRRANAGPLAVYMTISFGGYDALESHLQLVNAMTGIAVERFRLKHGHWPAALEDVVAAGLLDKIPLDAYDGKPLSLRNTTDGVVVSGVGPDLPRLPFAVTPPFAVKSCEFRLWDEKQRRQAPLPEK